MARKVPHGVRAACRWQESTHTLPGQVGDGSTRAGNPNLGCPQAGAAGQRSHVLQCWCCSVHQLQVSRPHRQGCCVVSHIIEQLDHVDDVILQRLAGSQGGAQSPGLARVWCCGWFGSLMLPSSTASCWGYTRTRERNGHSRVCHMATRRVSVASSSPQGLVGLTVSACACHRPMEVQFRGAGTLPRTPLFPALWTRCCVWVAACAL